MQQQGQAAEALGNLDLKQQGVRRRSSVCSLTRSHSAGEVEAGRPADALLPSASEQPPAPPSPPLAVLPLQPFQVLAPYQGHPDHLTVFETAQFSDVRFPQSSLRIIRSSSSPPPHNDCRCCCCSASLIC